MIAAAFRNDIAALTVVKDSILQKALDLTAAIQRLETLTDNIETALENMGEQIESRTAELAKATIEDVEDVLTGSVQVFPDPPGVEIAAVTVANVRDALGPFGVHLSIESVSSMLANLTPGEARAAGDWAEKFLDAHYANKPLEEVPIYLRRQL